MRAMSKASVSVPVAVPVASTLTRWSECIGLLIAGLAVSVKPLLGCISKVAMAGWWKNKALSRQQATERRKARFELDSRVREKLDDDGAEQRQDESRDYRE